MSKRSRSLLSIVLLMLLSLSLSVIASAQTEGGTQPSLVVIPGTIQSVLGCEGDWQPDCEATALTYDANDDLWSATFTLPAGEYEYKAALEGTWDVNYGANAELSGGNVALVLTEETAVRFIYNHTTHWVTDSVNSLIVNVAGSYQSQIGCPGDWQPDCLKSLLQDTDGDGVYSYATSALVAGAYEAKVAANESWDLNWGEAGEEGGANILFEVTEDNQLVEFSFDTSAGNILTISVGEVVPVTEESAAATEEATDATEEAAVATVEEPAATPAPAVVAPSTEAVVQPSLVVIPGTIQSVLGCEGDWQPNCEATALTYDANDDLWSATFTLPAGEYEYKAALEGTWDVNYGANAELNGGNIALVLTEETEVRFIYNHTTHWVTDSVNSLIVNVAGSYQSQIGCPGDWQPDCLKSLLQDIDGDGVYSYQTSALTTGSYEAKVAANESWTLNWGDGGAQGGANIPFVVAEDNQLVEFAFDTNNGNRMTIIVGGEVPPKAGNLTLAQAHWINADTIAWDIDRIPGAEYRLYYSPTGGLVLNDEGITGGEFIVLTVDRAGIGDAAIAEFPHLADYVALKLDPADADLVTDILRGQIAVISTYNQGIVQDATSVQIPGVLDALYAEAAAAAPLGIVFNDDRAPLFNLWAPTAQGVRVHWFSDADPTAEPEQIQDMTMDPATGIWQYWGDPNWYNTSYLFEVTVYAPSIGQVVTNMVTDPYSFGLAMDSQRSLIVDLNDPATMPEGWASVAKPALAAPEDIVLYELHVRDFSIYDASMPAEHRGTYLAFTDTTSNGMTHLRNLAEAGLTHIHLLPVFDIATIQEDPADRTAIAPAAMALFAPDGTEQQELVNSVRDRDGFNWGYDPLHYTVPEGSYSTAPYAANRIVEFRQMVQALNQNGLRVVMDVVYNHTNASGQNEKAVLDRIVPGYYHRLNLDGRVETSTCCSNTATEHAMMGRLMLDSLRTWATAYKIDGFRFDLMGHHMLSDMEAVRALLDGLTVDVDGVDGSQIYVYGEGWDFGEVASNARGINATQLNVGGTGIGTFNDRVRDAVRGGNPFGGLQEQGFATGLYVQPNEVETRTPEEQLERLLLMTDQIRVALAGNLRDYMLVNQYGDTVSGADIEYNGAPTGYTLDPQEHIVYVEAHDNETFFDVIQTKAPTDLPLSERIRMHNMGVSLTALSQGVPFFHAGMDMLRSKSGDKDSYNSGDWFNFLDFTYQDNGWGRGLPIADKNRDNWYLWSPLLANPDLRPSQADIEGSVAHFEEMLSIRRSSPLFRLQTAEQVSQVVRFHNTGVDQIPGLIVMELNDTVGASIDPIYSVVVVLFNASPDAVTYTVDDFAGFPLGLHQVQVISADERVRGSAFDPETGTFTIPGRSTSVFVALDQNLQ